PTNNNETTGSNGIEGCIRIESRERSMAPLDQLSHWRGQHSVQLVANGLFVALPEYAEVDNSKADDGQDEREDNAIPEHIVSQVSKVARRTQAAQNGKHPARKYSPDSDHCQVDAQVDEPVQLTVKVHRGQTAPEGYGAKQIEPERIVLSSADLNPEAQQCDKQAKPQGYELSQLPGGAHFVEQKRCQIHAQVPERRRDGHYQEWQAVTPKHDYAAR